MDAAASLPSEMPVQELPQYGFGIDVAFEKLVESNPFLFRVHTPKEQSPFYDRTEPYFVGQLFSDAFSSSTIHSRSPTSPSPYRSPAKSTYADVARHLDWTTRSSSPYVSCSFSFAWAIWEATRRYHHSMKHSVEIAVIDAKALTGRAVTAVELLRQGDAKDRHKDHWRWYRYATEAQDVLVWGYIPGTAVLASIPLTQVLNRLPSYFLSADAPDGADSPMARIGWDYARKKPSYRQFCQEVSDRFLRLSLDRRLRDTTAGSVRLALCLLRPWFHKLVLDDFTVATVSACDLALVMSRWPGQWWVREHPEIRDLVRCIVHIVGEEVREARRVQALADASRMQDIVGGLERLTHNYQSRSRHRRSLGGSSEPPLPPSEPESTPQPAQVEPEPAARELETVAPIPSPTTSQPFHVKDIARTASCLLTGFFVGSFVTLCALAPDTREYASFT
ncbi:hypothetical protein B0H21DRAFT_691332 [Amylocystis lapponica]|nr:hypothetical protein B0H21DRAFT_691332 [Amylocystis lapponica]